MPNNNPDGPPRRQSLEALSEASRVRLTRAKFKRKLNTGEVNLSTALRGELPDWLEGEPLGRLLVALKGVGNVRADRLVQKVTGLPGPGGFRTHFDVNSPVGGLTQRQRDRLADVLDTDYYHQ